MACRLLLCAVAFASSTSAWLPSELSALKCRNEQRTPKNCVNVHGRRERRRRAVLGRRAVGDEEERGSSSEGTPANPPQSLDLGSLTGMSEAARKAFGDMKFETELDDETRKQYEEAIAAEFDRNVKELESVGDELRGESQQSMENLKRAAEANMKEAEASAAQIEAYGKRVETMTERVKAETNNVAREVETLQALREEMKNDPLLRLANFREQGLPKQASLAAALLLFIRGGADGLSAAGALVTGGGAGDFAQTAVLQVGLSIAALVFYLFF